MDSSTILCVCSASAPFFAIAREVILNRRPWFTWCLVIAACTFAVAVTVIYFYASAADALCFDLHDVADRLWKCSGIDYSWDSTCCQEVEDDVSAQCGWDANRADFCSWFGDYTEEYCRPNYCVPIYSNVSVALSPNAEAGLVQDS